MATTVNHASSRPRRWRQMRARLLPLAAAVVLALGGAAEYLHLQSPTPVSAQVILRRAAAALPALAADQVIHEVAKVTTTSAPGVSAGVAGSTDPHVTVDDWVQLNANGAVVREDNSTIQSTGKLYLRWVRVGQTEKMYFPTDNSVTVSTAPESSPANRWWLQNPFGGAGMRQLVLDAQQGTEKELRLLPQQTMNGVTYDVVAISHTEQVNPQANAALQPSTYTLTLYIDAQSYIIRRMTITGVNDKGAFLYSSDLQVVTYETVPVSALPASVFNLNAPASAKVTVMR